jgi:hypothetical protein
VKLSNAIPECFGLCLYLGFSFNSLDVLPRRHFWKVVNNNNFCIAPLISFLSSNSLVLFGVLTIGLGFSFLLLGLFWLRLNKSSKLESSECSFFISKSEKGSKGFSSASRKNNGLVVLFVGLFSLRHSNCSRSLSWFYMIVIKKLLELESES